MVQISDLDVAHMRSQKLSLVLYGGMGGEAPSHLVRRLNAEDGMTFSTQRVEITEKTVNRGPGRGPPLFAPKTLLETQMHVFFCKAWAPREAARGPTRIPRISTLLSSLRTGVKG